ncbi:Ig-like domain-containing protein [Flavobacterium sp. Fl-77]|uniref:Ig-like domain-containing protein n=1 Tax=Flavobacterium flavipigmentatum TaxID=2893884 RepID=A0AAJ2VWM7_9FLAO|nr:MULTISPECIES: Ig-like domain-containing protein [unclassified Flavobacterium]MDX6180690.1 Ig-like domain-containing protein [Flavobacterium sp. Fl-33]MDX6184290.1 Ig-like domain-containing protein [Flavobacterium sp. Fl-77]UFH39401.1 Ig-like domain-containing protein [Flavobacterium sp. F-70]
MLKNNFRYISFLLVFLMMSCAKRGSITGGLKDTLAPILVSSSPKNFSTDFKGNEIVLTFDEYVKLKNTNKQLIISPPMKAQPIITPSNASKFIKIKIQDTLQPNTTYSFNFGQSITDNNEGNPYNQFKYIFSTGSYIDSLSIGGRIKDSYNKTTDNFVSVMLYDVNDKFEDSIIYKENPRYITNTLDSLSTFKLENLKAGKYLLIALKDKGNNNKYNPKEDKIGFVKHYINIPNDTLFELELFKETLPLKALKPVQLSGNRLLVPYEGKQNFKTSKPKIVLKNNDEILETIVTEFPKKDSLQVWYKPLKVDSLAMEISKDDYKKKYVFKIKDLKKDTLNISAIQNGTLNFRERFTLETATPLVKFDSSKIKLVNKDSTAVDFTTEYNEFEQKLYVDFKKEPSQKYNFTFLPGALTDFYEKSNDTLQYRLTTKEIEEYGNVILNLKNVKRFPIIIELINKKGDKILAQEYSEGETKFEFNLLEPELFTVRIIYDDNKNKIYDAGNFLKKEYSEEVNYMQKNFDVRSNWDVNETFDVSIPYNPELEKKEDDKKKKDDAKRKKTAF